MSDVHGYRLTESGIIPNYAAFSFSFIFDFLAAVAIFRFRIAQLVCESTVVQASMVVSFSISNSYLNQKYVTGLLFMKTGICFNTESGWFDSLWICSCVPVRIRRKSH